MTDATRKYLPEEILTLAKAIDGHKDSYDWLKKNNCLELAAVCCGVVNYDSSKTLDWLEKYDFRILWYFINAFDSTVETSFQYLMSCNRKEWGATYCASYGDNNAIKWLAQFGFRHYVMLSKAIYESLQRDENRRLYKGGLYRSGSGFGGSSGGFGGFGGGSFGGGGAGGSW